MQTIELERRPIKVKEFVMRGAEESDCETLIDSDCLVKLKGTGEPVIAYIDLKGKVDTDALRWACLTTKYGISVRTRGLVSQSRTFGYMPRRPILADYCHDSDIKAIGAKQSIVFKDFAKELEGFYREYFPDVLQKHYQTVEEKILPEWRIEGSPFTSGIVNKDNALKYHRDAGNFRGVFSNMVAFKKDIGGGRLCLPEFGIKFEIADNSLLIFDGQTYVHGVTPIIKLSGEAYRYSVVWYSLEQLWQCLPLRDEAKRIQTKKTNREKKRVELIREQKQK